MNWLPNIILAPLSWVYGWCVYVRNQLYNFGFLRSRTSETPTIVVGNLEVGGSGKTIHIAFLVSMLQKNLANIAVLSRGYKRKTKGFLLADAQNASVAALGDEPYQLFLQHQHTTKIAVCSQRWQGIEQIKAHAPQTQVVLLDDGFQHRALSAGFYVLLTDFAKPFYADKLLPLGRLREHKRAAKRADIIIITKSPKDLNVYDKKRMADQAKSVPRQKIIFSYLEYEKPINAQTNQPTDIPAEAQILLVTGIAKPTSLLEYLHKHFRHITHIAYADHYRYKTKDLEKIKKQYDKLSGSNKWIICTEKDWVKLKQFSQFFAENAINWAYLPVKTSFSAADAEVLETSLTTYVKQANLLQTTYKKHLKP